MVLTVGSLCTGYGGIELGLTLAGLEHRLAFVADPDRAASILLAMRHPEVVNLGDITTVDWGSVPHVDMLTAGYPCQPFSCAGMRKGTADVRHLWPFIADAVRVVRPGSVLLENVAGHRSMGFGRVLGDLAGLGYVGSWRSVRASDIGAAHRRERVFIFAHLADAPGLGHGNARPAMLAGVPAATVASGIGAGPLKLLPTPHATEGRNSVRNREGKHQFMLAEAVHQKYWDRYAPAIARWQAATGRPAPEHVEPAKEGVRLAAPFVEWLMGLPPGWVCDVPGLSRTQKLRLLGNGVVPGQLAHALDVERPNWRKP